MSAQAQGRPSPLDVNVAPFAITEGRLGDDGLILSVQGELDLGTQPQLREHLQSALEGGVRRLVVDLSKVTFIDSVSVAAIVKAQNRLGEDGRIAVVLAEDSYAMLIFEVGGMASVLHLVHTRDEALAHVGA